VSQIEPWIRVELPHLLKRRVGLDVSMHRQCGRTQARPRMGVRRIQFERAAKRADRFLMTPASLQRHTQVVVSGQMRRRRLCHLQQRGDGLIRPILGKPHRGQ